MKVLITGAAGYIGSKLTSKLFSLGLKLTCLDNLMFGQNNSFILNNKNINFIKGDVRDKNLIKSIVKKFDLIIPLAAIVGAPLCSKMPKETEEINFESIKYLVENLSKNQIVIMPVTNSGYGIGDPEKFCDEDTPLKPISLYGITKVKAEKIIMERENSISFRLATVFGVSERMRIDLMVNNFVYIAIKEKYFKLYEPHFRRNYIHIEDVVSGFHFAINNFNNLKNNIYNLGLSEANLTKEDLCKKIQLQIPDFNYEIVLDGKDEDKRDYFVSNKKIESKGFKAKISLEDGIRELKMYFEKDNLRLFKNY
jgi:nucleoside-diphosphate-sugar epimerase